MYGNIWNRFDPPCLTWKCNLSYWIISWITIGRIIPFVPPLNGGWPLSDLEEFMSGFVEAGRNCKRLLRERQAQRCTDCFHWDPIRWSKHRPTWGECRRHGCECKWTYGLGCLDFRRRPSRAFLRLVKGWCPLEVLIRARGSRHPDGPCPRGRHCGDRPVQ